MKVYEVKENYGNVRATSYYVFWDVDEMPEGLGLEYDEKHWRDVGETDNLALIRAFEGLGDQLSYNARKRTWRFERIDRHYDGVEDAIALIYSVAKVRLLGQRESKRLVVQQGWRPT